MKRSKPTANVFKQGTSGSDVLKSMVFVQLLQHVGSTGGFARNFNMWGGVGWGGVGCVNVGVHVYTWYAAGVLMCTHGTLLVC